MALGIKFWWDAVRRAAGIEGRRATALDRTFLWTLVGLLVALNLVCLTTLIGQYG